MTVASSYEGIPSSSATVRRLISTWDPHARCAWRRLAAAGSASSLRRHVVVMKTSFDRLQSHAPNRPWCYRTGAVTSA